MLKLSDLGHFQAMLSRYALVPPTILPGVASFLAFLEIFLGLGLLLGWARYPFLLLSEILFYLFSLAIASVLWRDLRILCGCLGLFSLRLGWKHLAFCLATALTLSWRRTSAC